MPSASLTHLPAHSRPPPAHCLIKMVIGLQGHKSVRLSAALNS